MNCVHIFSYSEKPNKVQQCIKIFLLFLILNEAQHVLGYTPPIIRSLKLHQQPLVLRTWKVVRHADVGRQVAYEGAVHCTVICYLMGGVSLETC
jgi:hypothetical protein